MNYDLYSRLGRDIYRGFWPRVSLEKVIIHLVNDRPLNPYLQGSVGQLLALTSLCPKNYLSHVSHGYVRGKPWGKTVPP